ncbi:hypothetical protein R0J91_19980, partial [Micrococcus sp. SIMBA_131]
EPSLLLDVTERKETIQFVTPIIYDNKVESDIYGLANAVFYEKEEEIVDEQLIKLIDGLINQSTTEKYVKKNIYINKIKERI